jgi:hypothetical protein
MVACAIDECKEPGVTRPLRVLMRSIRFIAGMWMEQQLFDAEKYKEQLPSVMRQDLPYNSSTQRHLTPMNICTP